MRNGILGVLVLCLVLFIGVGCQTVPIELVAATGQTGAQITTLMLVPQPVPIDVADKIVPLLDGIQPVVAGIQTSNDLSGIQLLLLDRLAEVVTDPTQYQIASAAMQGVCTYARLYLEQHPDIAGIKGQVALVAAAVLNGAADGFRSHVTASADPKGRGLVP